MYATSGSGADSAVDALLLPALTRRLRSMRQFAQEEIILPTGPHEGRRFRVDRQPFAGLVLDEIDSGKWRRFALTGPAQSGKTLLGFVIPTLYHLFEIGETVIIGLPTMDMAGDKWRQDLYPVIAASRYRDLLPESGRGSKGAVVRSVEFRNGRTLRFMTGGGDDKSRAGFTSRVVVITEVDGMDRGSATSREADPISQLEARTQAFGDRGRVYLECTVSTEQGRIWREYKGGSESRIEVKCPHCSAYVTTERAHLVGWQSAENALDAAAKASLTCPGCGSLWTEAQRIEANRSCRIAHTPKQTDTLGFRWTAANNLLVPLSEVARREWQAQRNEDSDAEKALRQFVWCQPVEPDKVDLSGFDWQGVLSLQGSLERGKVPDAAQFLVAGIDLGKHLCHWTVTAWIDDRTSHVVDYGVLEVSSGELGIERALALALRDFRDRVAADGWGGRKLARVFVDSGYFPDAAFAFCAETPGLYWPCKGFGEKQVRVSRAIEEFGWEGVKQPSGMILVELLADRWKTRVHDAIQAKALTLWRAEKQIEHMSFAKHLTAERKVEEFVAGKGTKTRWELDGKKPNHWLDATALSFAAAATMGTTKQQQQQQHKQPDTTIDPTDYIGRRGKW